MQIKKYFIMAGFGLATLATPASAVTITFDDIVRGVTSYGYDADFDGIIDATFSTADNSGFNSFGPGANQLYISEPGIEGTQLLPVDLRVDFSTGAVGSLGFGFAVSSGSDAPGAVRFSIYDLNNTLLSSVIADALKGASTFPEGLVNLGFSGTASYATFDFLQSNGSTRYIVDNFTGSFGSAGGVPEPAVWAQFLLGFGFVGYYARRRRTAATA